MLELSNNAEQLYSLLMQIPPDLEQSRNLLENGCCAVEDVNEVALRYVEECWCEGVFPCKETSDSTQQLGDYCWEAAAVIPNLHSTYLYEVMELLIKFGLNPNVETDERNILEMLPHVVNEYIAADTLALLFENGADLQLKIRDGEGIFSALDFEVVFAAIEQYDRRRYDSLVHCWLVYIGYGVKLDDGREPVDLFFQGDFGHPFEKKDLRNHRNYFIGLSHLKNRGERWSLHIFDKRSLWEVARL